LGDDLAHAAGKNPELILNNFSTRLGVQVGRMFAALFPQNAEVSTLLLFVDAHAEIRVACLQFRSRRVITLHNQRDFIFFRQHRYVFEESKDTKSKDKEPVKHRRCRGVPL
jgi:ribosome production factor 1